MKKQRNTQHDRKPKCKSQVQARCVCVSDPVFIAAWTCGSFFDVFCTRVVVGVLFSVQCNISVCRERLCRIRVRIHSSLHRFDSSNASRRPRVPRHKHRRGPVRVLALCSGK